MVDMTNERQKLARRLGRRIAEHRKALGWTQDLLAERLGVDAETVSRFERGVTVPSLLTLEKLADILGTRMADLLAEAEIASSEPAARIAVWLALLSGENQQFVMTQIRMLCEHLRNVQADPHK